MTALFFTTARLTGRFPAAVAAVALLAAGCASTARNSVPSGTTEPDQYLFQMGNEQLERERWLVAREYFKQVTETYTQSPVRPDAKLGVGDTYLGEGTAEALVLAINEFQEFLAFYPTHPRADYAQYKLAMAHFRQMRGPQRDQTETRAAMREFEAFIARYPNSALMPDVGARLREARDRLSESEYWVALTYFRLRWFPGTISRLTGLLKSDPEYTGRDAVYFYLGESLLRSGRAAEALPYFEKLVAEFERSEHLTEAQQRISELKSEAARKQ